MAGYAEVPATPADRVVPLRGVRGMIADKMLRSLSEAAQLTHHADCRADALLRRKAALTETGVKVSIEDLILDRVVATLLNHPDLNGIVKGKEVHLSGAVHLSVAMALPGNLLVAPAIFNAEKLTTEARAAARKDLAERARANKLTVPEMTGGTFTVSNLGLSRVRYFTPILNTPQIGILGIGRIAEVAFPDGKGGVEFHPVMGLSLTFDHQAVDGAPAAAFLSDLCAALEAA
ncbi:2-oxo acid dehydrogenase subunit E2 [Aquamicrobium terrae]|uniref:Pyruvate dehydrogenase E2 component (Dihydrolipoamide acetyltransferase) n=1 Tax=Aquamicrobium terrae TaxID=1324945 RepID=A0ABV2N5J3_9HYPH